MMKNRQGYKKLYKSGKLWIAVSSGLLFLGTAVLTDQTQIVQADTLTPTQQTHATAVVANTAEPTTTTPQAVATAVAQPTPVEPRTVALQTTVNTSLGIKTVAITGTTGSTITVNAPIVAGYTADQPTLSATINVAGTIATINSNPYITYTPTTASTQPAMAGTDTTSAPVTTIATKTASVDATAAQSATAKTTDKPTTQPNATIDQDQAVSDTKIAKTTSDDSKAINDQETHDLSGSYQKDSLTSNQPQLASRSNDDVSFHEIYFDGTTGDNTSGSSNASDISGITPGPTDITSAVFWGYAVDINTSDYLGHPEAQLTINPSVPNSMSLTSVTNIGSPSYWESAGFTDNVEVIFTTTNGQTDTQKIVAGQSDYVATVGSASDPVVSVTIRSVDAVRPPGSRGTWNAHQVFLYHATFYTKDPVTVQYHLNGTIKDAADKIMRTHEKWLTINYGYGPAITLWQDRSTLPGTFIWSDVTNYTGKSIKYASPGQTIYFSDNLLS
ncbi:hypothetical protein JCM14202_2846 [Agrilactobacillus composti DSM 18527 = JCM 14202]|nr:KxYKxGKxW signal peptide domain-containing protein [Agrilactobacillus composti]GAF40935.1 hypothetical protein JCM14202_2846 [Agrilactobacillus composti DSM 18527 = JCM 14202]